jgi:hypothetical protein
MLLYVQEGASGVAGRHLVENPAKVSAADLASESWDTGAILIRPRVDSIRCGTACYLRDNNNRPLPRVVRNSKIPFIIAPRADDSHGIVAEPCRGESVSGGASPV